MKPALTPIVPTRRMSEAIAAVCKTCGSVLEQGPWELSKSVGLHSNNGQCGGRKQIVLLGFQADSKAAKQ